MNSEENYMNAYLVFMRDSSIPREPGRNPRRTAIVEYFDDLGSAQSFAQTEQNTRDFVTVFKRMEGSELQEIEEYREGRKYGIQDKQ